ncbi:uncharacterized protein LOC122635802 [Vespula pensylvanica]|uniref:Protein quiver n=1 Tax=Vespula pensylvanica TaxID=30213 RepID=A0A834UGP7_VESPE|nr:uncharacterized protein LOC122635802 [Vespula pensylvanica]KAF7438529.1 hypothetical protein H0235_000920 [Vespula pensylvanica]
MSQRRSNTQIALCILFTGLFLGSIELGQGLKCYECSSLNDTSCANPSSSHIRDCLATEVPITSTTPSNISSPFKEQEEPSNDLNFITYAEGITYSCFTGHFTLQNGTTVENIIIRGCTPQTFSCLDESIINVGKEIRSCNIEFCQTDQCNSSDMVKMGMISLLLPLITILLRIR